MAIEHDHNAEREARIDLLLSQATRTDQRPSSDIDARISKHLDELKRLGSPVVSDVDPSTVA